jgi:SnoaL-like domain
LVVKQTPEIAAVAAAFDLKRTFRRRKRHKPEGRWEIEMDDRAVRAALQRHWDASDASDFEVEHEIYREDALLDYPQSGERIRGRHNIQESRTVQPNKKRFTVRRIIGSGDLWVTEFVLTYDGVPSYAVSIMEFREGLVAHETQYFADRFDPGPSRAHLVEREGEITSS